MLFLFAVSAQAQSIYYGGNINAGTPAPVYAGPQSPQSYYVPPPVPPPASNPAFDLSQMNRQVLAARYQADGHNLFYTTPFGVLFPNVDTTGLDVNAFGQYGNFLKAKGNQIDEHRLDRQIDYVHATQPMTVDSQNQVDDLVLKEQIAHNEYLRRAAAIIPGSLDFGTPSQVASAFFDRRAQQDNVQLAKNSLFDARQAYGTDPNQPHERALRDARENVQQADDRRDATTFDVLGNHFHGAVLGPAFRKKASQEKLDVGYRDLRDAQDAYAKDPSEDNRLALKLAQLFVRATSQEDDANTDDVLVGAAFGGNVKGLIAGQIASSKNSQDESDLWLKYNRLQRQILIRKQQEALQARNANPVAQQMLALQNYGPNTNQAATGYPNNRNTITGGPQS
jgi:hypothetical protein